MFLKYTVDKIEPVTTTIAKDLDKEMKDPLSTTANSQYPKIDLWKILN